MADGAVHLPLVDELTTLERPRTRGECVDGVRPCPHLSCRYSLRIDLVGSNVFVLGALADDDDETDDDPAVTPSCALDVAEEGGVTLEEIGELLQLSRERVRQIEAAAIAKVERKIGPEWRDHVGADDEGAGLGARLDEI